MIAPFFPGPCKRNYQLMPALKWLRLLLNHVPDQYEHLVRYYGYYSNRSRGVRRRRAKQHDATAASIVIDEPPPDARRKARWARLIQKVYEVDPLACPNCGATLRIIALIDEIPHTGRRAFRPILARTASTARIAPPQGSKTLFQPCIARYGR